MREIVVALAAIRGGRILLVRKRGLPSWILPGGRPEFGESEMQALTREISEDLGCGLIPGTVERLGEWTDVSADNAMLTVRVVLYRGELDGPFETLAELEEASWYGPQDVDFPGPLAPSLRNKIVPDLVAAGLLEG
jgi:8-oxo-dGTP diphosphatase